jgi:hypothetical protein
MITSGNSSHTWKRAEKALVDGDVAALDALLARHGTRCCGTTRRSM